VSLARQVRDDDPVIRPLLDDRDLAALRTALDGYTVDGVHEAIGLAGQAALQRGDLVGAARALAADDPLETLIRLFVLGETVTEKAARGALHPLPVAQAAAGGLIKVEEDSVRALLDVRPYAEGSDDHTSAWWVVSDFGADVRRRPLSPDHVLGVGAAALTLAQATPRSPVRRALDIGTGCGVQALHLSNHADEVVATDISERALQLAATTAGLSGRQWDLRQGSLLDPVAGEQYELIVSNPPFVVSPGDGGYDYRDSGLPGDAFCATLVRGMPRLLTEGGTAQLLANWVVTADEPWRERVGGWLAGSGCDAWVWQRELADPGEYVSLWLRDAGESPGTPGWARRYNAWLDWFAAHGIVAVGMGLVTLWRTGSQQPAVVLEDVPQVLEQPIWGELPAWHARQRWLAARPAGRLLDARLLSAPGLALASESELTGAGWQDTGARLRQTRGMRWEVETDDAISALIAGCDGRTPVRTLISLLAASLERSADDVATAALPVIRDLVSRGFLTPADAS